MRVIILVLWALLTIDSAMAKSHERLADRCPKTTPEARGLELVECPATWPLQAGEPLKAESYWDRDLIPTAPLCRETTNEGKIDINGVDGPTYLGCVYTNGARLLISVPGTPIECHLSDRKRFKTGHLNDGIVCYFMPTGDAARDEIKISELESLTRAFEFFGLRLGMSRAEVERVLNAQGARIIASEGHEIHATLTDGKKL